MFRAMPERLKTWDEKETENQRVYDAAKKIISEWPEWKKDLADWISRQTLNGDQTL